ncbi:allophanate hydrolase [Yinghuangia sp. ASG 101]|uniref:allophanate hydrolase n=1 Tax=Yinghuangia sp. ASG 101 TaxID=2896848 RepID=UPI001E526AE1|nr:allophanate hydrolase [Yinghuangia sp. ASG 101]UGQ12553.1 allophanate hydrolase [Yinghuangia sp. ASG 101]
MTGPSAARVRRALALLAEGARPEAWIALRPAAELLADAEAIDARTAAGDRLPLAGRVFAVKDNIDAAGLPTTAGCPSFAYRPAASAPAVARLTAAGAVLVGKTNLDQFATGLVGTRSPYGAVRAVHDPARVSGGSSSGSAVAVALGIVDFALGTDTAGSGRVPAAFAGLVGLKPTLGLIPTEGVVPAARPFDCVTVFAPDLDTAETVAALMAAGPPTATTRDWPADAPAAAPAAPRVAVPEPAALTAMSGPWQAAFAAAASRLAASGATLVPVDATAFLRAGELLYGGAFAAERYAAVGEFVVAGGDDVDPTVRTIVADAAALPAHRYAADLARLAELRARALESIAGCDALLLPTAPEHPTLAAVAAEPIGVNSRLGAYTNFVNLLDLCAVAVPAGHVDGGPFGVTVIARAFADRVAADIAAMLGAEPAPPRAHDTGPGREQTPETRESATAHDEPHTGWGPPGLPLAVFGAHLTGQPLNPQLTALGARFLRPVRTAPHYRMVALPGTPPRPGLLRLPPDGHGHSITGELWALPAAGLGRLLASLPEPMALGRVSLDDGNTVTGFLCEPHAARDAPDISAHQDWRAYLRRGSGEPAEAPRREERIPR